MVDAANAGHGRPVAGLGDLAGEDRAEEEKREE